MSIEAKIKALKDFQSKVGEIVIELTKEYKAEIIDMNTAQLEKGKEATGLSITPDYTPFTVRIKRSKGQPTDRVTLRDTGDFYKDFNIIFKPTHFLIFSDDEKEEKLERKYGKEIFGLADENLQDLIELVKPDLIQYFRKLVA